VGGFEFLFTTGTGNVKGNPAFARTAKTGAPATPSAKTTSKSKSKTKPEPQVRKKTTR
jgi:hypothetical protein